MRRPLTRTWRAPANENPGSRFCSAASSAERAGSGDGRVYTITYGAFAGVIVTLLFFYLTGAAMIFGAEVNGALMAMGHRRE